MQSKFVSALLFASSMLSVQAFNVSDIDEATREFWCQSQTSQCPLLCADLDKTTLENSCWPENLYFLCKCEGNVEPNATQYSQTIPYFTCSLQLTDCVNNCGTNPSCQTECKKSFKCGATDPTKPSKTAQSASATPSKTGDSSSGDGSDSGFATSDGGNAGGNGGSGAGSLVLQLGSSYGLGVVAVGIAVAFIGL